MNYLNSGSCTPTSCRYCCTPYLNGYYCGTQSQCGACLSTATATIVIVVVCSVLFLALIAFMIYNLGVFSNQFIPSAIVQPNSQHLYGSQFGGISGSGIMYGYGNSGIRKGNTAIATLNTFNNGVHFQNSGINYTGGYESAAAQAQAAVYGVDAGRNIGLAGSAVLYDVPANNNTINFGNQLKGTANTNTILSPRSNFNGIGGGFGVQNTNFNTGVAFTPNISRTNSQGVYNGSYNQNSFNVGVNNQATLASNGIVGAQSGVIGIQNKGISLNQQCIGNGLTSGSINNFGMGSGAGYANGIHTVGGGLGQGVGCGFKNNASIGISGVSNTVVSPIPSSYNSNMANAALTSDFVVGTDRTLLNTPKKTCYR